VGQSGSICDLSPNKKPPLIRGFSVARAGIEPATFRFSGGQNNR
jgi:hypothetical protein